MGKKERWGKQAGSWKGSETVTKKLKEKKKLESFLILGKKDGEGRPGHGRVLKL